MTRRLLVASLGLIGIGGLEACTIPVFRYALDRWAPDRYRLEVAARDAADPEIARFLRNSGATSPLNLDVKRLPPEAAEPSRLFAPGAETPLWEGALQPATLAAWTDSPFATEVSRRLLAGESSVWILAESGDPAADAKVAALIENRLRYLEQVAQLPAIDPDDPDSQLGPGPALAVKFSLLRLPATPATASFRQLLAGTGSDLATANEPWIAAVYGRGRVLGAWRAAAVGDEQIEQGCLFLLGACSCRVKNLNPGWDLLLPVDWDARLQAITPPDAPAPEAPPVPERVRISGRSDSPPRATPGWRVYAGGGALLAGFFLVGFAIRRQILSRRP
jgi:hypothetical protein